MYTYIDKYMHNKIYEYPVDVTDLNLGNLCEDSLRYASYRLSMKQLVILRLHPRQ